MKKKKEAEPQLKKKDSIKSALLRKNHYLQKKPQSSETKERLARFLTTEERTP